MAKDDCTGQKDVLSIKKNWLCNAFPQAFLSFSDFYQDQKLLNFLLWSLSGKEANIFRTLKQSGAQMDCFIQQELSRGEEWGNFLSFYCEKQLEISLTFISQSLTSWFTECRLKKKLWQFQHSGGICPFKMYYTWRQVFVNFPILLRRISWDIFWPKNLLSTKKIPCCYISLKLKN